VVVSFVFDVSDGDDADAAGRDFKSVSVRQCLRHFALTAHLILYGFLECATDGRRCRNARLNDDAK
jgi:hypothetical protein